MTTTIEINMNIKENNYIDNYSVMQACIKNDLYTLGTPEDYTAMLNKAAFTDYSIGLLYELAVDICKHSEDQTITNIMCILKNDAVTTTYEINGEDTI